MARLNELYLVCLATTMSSHPRSGRAGVLGIKVSSSTYFFYYMWAKALCNFTCWYMLLSPARKLLGNLSWKCWKFPGTFLQITVLCSVSLQVWLEVYSSPLLRQTHGGCVACNTSNLLFLLISVNGHGKTLPHLGDEYTIHVCARVYVCVCDVMLPLWLGDSRESHQGSVNSVLAKSANLHMWLPHNDPTFSWNNFSNPNCMPQAKIMKGKNECTSMPGESLFVSFDYVLSLQAQTSGEKSNVRISDVDSRLLKKLIGESQPLLTRSTQSSK